MESNSRTEVKQCLVEPSDRTETTRVDGRVMYDPRTSDHDSSSQISHRSATDQRQTNGEVQADERWRSRQTSDGPVTTTPVDGPATDEQTDE